MLRTAARRPGFTLVELMVAAAVCVLIMAVLATAFQLGIDTMRQMKSTGELMDQLRGASTALQADLKANHLLDKNGQPVKLSSFRWDQVQVIDNGAMANPRFVVSGWSAPDNGFVRIRSGPLTPEGSDADGLTSGRATNHYLHFTSVLSGLSDDDYYAATTPPGGPTFRSTAAEIAYFLDPVPVGITPGGTNLFRLVRRQRLVALNDTDRRDRPWPTNNDQGVISLRPSGVANPLFFLCTLGELTSPFNRLGGSPTNTAAYAPTAGLNDSLLSPMASRIGDDTLLSNVISFEVQAVWTVSNDVRLPIVNAPRPFGTTAGTTTDNPFDVLPNGPGNGNNIPGLGGTPTYDSWNQGMSNWTQPPSVNQTNGTVQPGPNVPPLLIRVQAVQVRIRMWDPKLQNARQVTIMQDL